MASQSDTDALIDGNPHGVGDSAPDAEGRPAPLIPVLAHEPELAEIVEAWSSLDEPVRAEILQLVRVKTAPR